MLPFCRFKLIILFICLQFQAIKIAGLIILKHMNLARHKCFSRLPDAYDHETLSNL